MDKRCRMEERNNWEIWEFEIFEGATELFKIVLL